MAGGESRYGRRYAWWASLQFQLVAVSVVLLLLLVGAAFWLSDRLIRSELIDEATAQTRAETDRSVDALATKLSELSLIAQPLAVAFNTGVRDEAFYSSLGAQLLESAHARTDGLVVGLGLWPAEGTWRAGRERAAQHWTASDAGVQQRQDFNDPRRIPYQGELWYTLSRYAPAGRCTWTGRRTDLLLGTDVVTCTQPVMQGERWRGAATVDVSLTGLRALLRATHPEGRGYGLLVDAAGRLLATTPDAPGGDAANLAGLSQQSPALSPLAVAMHADEERRVQRSIELDRYQAETVSQLRDGTRDLARSEAESLLALQWTGARRGESPPLTVGLDADPALGEAAIAHVRDVGTTGWRYAAVGPISSGLGHAGYLVTQSLVLTSGLVIIAMLLVLGLVRLRVLNPIRRMIRTLQSSDSLEDALDVTLDESARNEVGELAHWLNHRSALLSDISQQAQAVNTQLVLEVGERKTAVQSLAATRERAEMTLKCIADGVITTERSGQIEFMNPVAESLLGRSNQESHGRPVSEVLLLGRANGEDAYDVVREAMTSGKRRRLSDLAVKSASGSTRRVAVTVAPVRGRGGDIIGSVIAIHEHGDTTQADKPQAVDLSRDTLTGLFSRTTFDEDIEALIEQQAVDGSRHALLLLDVDQMRRINDTHGEQAGNEVLRHLAHLVGSEVGRDGRTYRLGGDKLLVLLRDATMEAAEDRCDTIRRAIADTPFRWEGKQIVPEISVGLVKIDPGAGTAMELLRRAESAVQSAKVGGGNCNRRYRVEERAAVSRGSDDVWTERVRAGLEQELFHLMSQTIEPLASGLSPGMEIHVSLEDEEGFWASPTAFMPAAVRAGLAPDIDRMVLRQMLEFASSQTDASSDTFYAVNLSSASLRDVGFLDQILELIDSHDLPASRIAFEIDEAAAVRHRVETHEVLSALRPVGCRFVLDNFSSGMDGAELLKALRFDYVKLHQNLSSRAAGERVDRVALDAVIRVLRELDIRVIAGRVDNPAARAPLTELGVDYIQGFAVGRPTPLMFQFAGSDP